MSRIPKLVRAARRVSTPLLAIRTADPAATIESIKIGFNGGAPPMLQWDVCRGISGVNDIGAEWLRQSRIEPDSTSNPADAIKAALDFPDKAILFFMNAQAFIEDASVSQGIWNLRDEYKRNRRTLVLLCPAITLPAALTQDVLVIDEPLPDDKQLLDIALGTYTAAGLEKPDEPTLTKIVDATLGLAAFPAEQSMAMCLGKDGMDLPDLWERKRSLIEQTPGLSVWRGGEKFSDIGGCDNIKGFLRDILAGNAPPRAICFLDEIEKAIGTGQDTSGVSQNLLGTLLSWMQDNDATGVIMIGPPGAAKSAIAKAAGNEAGIPTIAVDMGGMKASLVGESEQRFRQALKVVDAVSQKRALFLATCNSIAILPPELRRRFTFGTFFFDLPSREERAAIWSIYLKKFEVTKQPLPADEGWTGAEIRQCCSLAWRLRRPLVECAKFIVPVSRSAADQIEKLRNDASGRFISAAVEGYYEYKKKIATAGAAGRAISFDSESN